MENQEHSVHSEAEGIPSPFAAKRTTRIITKEDLDKVKALLGVECVFIVTDSEKHDCTEETCTGHYYSSRQSGFSDDQMDGLIIGLYERLQEGMFVKGDED